MTPGGGTPAASRMAAWVPSPFARLSMSAGMGAMDPGLRLDVSTRFASLYPSITTWTSWPVEGARTVTVLGCSVSSFTKVVNAVRTFG